MRFHFKLFPSVQWRFVSLSSLHLSSGCLFGESELELEREPVDICVDIIIIFLITCIESHRIFCCYPTASSINCIDIYPLCFIIFVLPYDPPFSRFITRAEFLGEHSFLLFHHSSRDIQISRYYPTTLLGEV